MPCYLELKYWWDRKYYMFFIAVFLSFPSMSQECPHLMYGIPSKYDTILCRLGYAVGYNYNYKVPDWVSYIITDSLSNSINIARPENMFNGYDYKEDTEIPEQYRSTNADYDEPIYDVGHMAPNASIDYDTTAQLETFYLTNMTPQLAGFNRAAFGRRGAWGELENLERTWVKTHNKLCVIAGTIFEGTITKIGNGVAVPTAFYKVFYSPFTNEAIAFLLPHEEDKRHELKNYILSIDSLEAITNIDFLDKLSDNQQNIIENRYNKSKWPLRNYSIPTSNTSITSKQCQGTTKRGTRCRRKTTNQNGYCNLHQPPAH